MSGFIHPISQLVHCTVRISCFDNHGNESYGSGYIYHFCVSDSTDIPCIVTNKHVLKGAVRGVFHLTLKKSDGSPDVGVYESIALENIESFCIPHPVPEVDLIAIPIGAVLNRATRNGREYYYVALSVGAIADAELLSSLPPMEDIVMIGYPIGIWDEVNNYPIIRKGITATHPGRNLNNKPEFLIDAACFPGSSGSPVFLANIGSYIDKMGVTLIGNRVALLGTLYAGPQHTTTGEIVVVDIPTNTRPVAVGTIPTNLGYVINVGELAVLEEAIRKVSEMPRISRNASCMCGSGRRYKNCCGSC